jgi:surface carbohydrate biosynthesis protein
VSHPRILLLAGNLVRDLAGIVLTALELTRRGATCYVAPYRGSRAEAWALAPDFVLLPVFRPYQAEQCREFTGAGVQFGLLDSEGAVWSSMEEYRSTVWSDAGLRSATRCVCAWGDAMAEYLVREGLFARSQVWTTGCPRFDYYSRALAPALAGPSGIRGLAGRRLVLINTNFTISNQEGVDARIEMEKLIQNYGYRRSDVESWFQSEQRAIVEIVSMANRLAADCPSAEIVIRPHPEENPDSYRQGLGTLPNLRVSKEGTVMPWILRSAAVIQRGCTTAIEACLAGSLAISPKWITLTKEYPLPEFVSVPCEEYGELLDTVRQAINGAPAIDARLRDNIESTIRQWFCAADGRAHQRVASVVLETMDSRVGPNPRRCRERLYGIGKRGVPLPTRAGNQLRYRLGLSPHHSFRPQARGRAAVESGWSRELVEGQVRALEAVMPSTGRPPVVVHEARECGAYLVRRFEGRTVVLEAR